MSRHPDPQRIEGPIFGAKRQAVLDECNALETTIHHLDAQLDALTRQRQHAARQLRERRQRLWPNLAKRARRCTTEGRHALPAIAHHATALWGRRLRRALRDLLTTRNGPITLTELHALLHRQGFFVDTPYPVKTLSDALRYELQQGRVKRTQRATYALT